MKPRLSATVPPNSAGDQARVGLPDRQPTGLGQTARRVHVPENDLVVPVEVGVLGGAAVKKLRVGEVVLIEERRPPERRPGAVARRRRPHVLQAWERRLVAAAMSPIPSLLKSPRPRSPKLSSSMPNWTKSRAPCTVEVHAVRTRGADQNIVEAVPVHIGGSRRTAEPVSAELPGYASCGGDAPKGWPKYTYHEPRSVEVPPALRPRCHRRRRRSGSDRHRGPETRGPAVITTRTYGTLDVAKAPRNTAPAPPLRGAR